MSLKKDKVFLQAEALALAADRISAVRLHGKGKDADAWEIQHDCKGTLWCGAAAFSAITGLSTSVFRDLIRKKRGNVNANVAGTDENEMEYALRKSGFKMAYAYMFGGRAKNAHPTFGHFLQFSRKERARDVFYLIAFAGYKPRKDVPREPAHWGVVFNNLYLCSLTEKWVPFSEVPNKRRPVDAVFAIKKA
jgi:hypothetical protein